MDLTKLDIKETRDGLYINGVKQPHVTDVQVIKNLHKKVKVQVTYWADSFIKEDFGVEKDICQEK